MSYGDCIHLAACREKEALPTNPDLPADVFTSCLTTPIEMAVRFFIMQNPIPSGVTLVDAANIPGKTSERRTPLGELNWIFTAITDTIAWNLLPKPLFKKLFRQDLMVAALFRNFLLAQRIMRVYHCHPQCYPEIPQTHDHPLWDSWDYAIEMVLLQLPDLIAAERGQIEYEYQHSKFFAEQLTAFEIYLRQGAVKQKIPEQLPIVLQVLL
ncbi:Target of rapamycin complex 1 subunit kog1, partial [Cryomyces antarcticus]